MKYANARCAEEGEQAATGPTLASFSCRQTSVFLGASASDVIEINFLPFSPGNKFAVLVLSNPHVGEFLYTSVGHKHLSNGPKLGPQDY